MERSAKEQGDAVLQDDEMLEIVRLLVENGADPCEVRDLEEKSKDTPVKGRNDRRIVADGDCINRSLFLS